MTPEPHDDLDAFMLDEIARDPDMAARFKVAEYRQRAEAAEDRVVVLEAELGEAREIVGDLEIEVTAWRAEAVQRYGVMPVAPDDVVGRAVAFLARYQEETTLSYHARDGLHFERRKDGSVAVTIEVSGQDANGRAFSWPREYVLLDADTWASAVASVSAAGENRETFDAAVALHMRGADGRG
jgi:hypothetical protein